jgi:hypothetical protein
MSYKTVLSLNSKREVIAGSEKALINAINRGADLRIYTEFNYEEHIETGLLELYLTKLGQRKGFTWWADSWRYFIDVDGHLGCAK